MKKSILTLLGLFTILACSDDAYDEANSLDPDYGYDQGVDGGMKGNTFDDADAGYIDLFGGGPFINPGVGYWSPWDIWYRNVPFTPIYTFSNRGTSGHVSSQKIVITPYVGLAYYDGNNDGIYEDPFIAKSNGGNGFVTTLSNGNYPKLFHNSQEVGNLISADPITLDGSSLADSELSIASDPSTPEHLLLTPGNKHSLGHNPNSIVFSFNNIGLTPDEEQLLRDYGKVFYYEVSVYDRVTNTPITSEKIQARNRTLENPSSNPFWNEIIGYDATINATSTSKIVYYYFDGTKGGVNNETIWPNPYPTFHSPNDPNITCNSREVVVEKIAENYLKFFNPIEGRDYEMYISMTLGSYLWQTGGPNLVVRPL